MKSNIFWAEPEQAVFVVAPSGAGLRVTPFGFCYPAFTSTRAPAMRRYSWMRRLIGSQS
jgi:hypothetical protein